MLQPVFTRKLPLKISQLSLRLSNFYNQMFSQILYHIMTKELSHAQLFLPPRFSFLVFCATAFAQNRVRFNAGKRSEAIVSQPIDITFSTGKLPVRIV